MDLVTELDAKLVGVGAEFGGLFHEALLAFLHEVEAAAAPEAPWIAGGQFPTEGDAPEHGHGFDLQLGGEVHEVQQIFLVPGFDLLRRELGDLGAIKGLPDLVPVQALV